MSVLSFGYGSNMLLKKVKVNVPSATIICRAFIRGYKFCFNKYSNKDGSGKGNIVKTNTESDIVWGVVFQVSDSDKKALDDEEGLNKGYNEILITVTDIEGKNFAVHCYIADNSAIDDKLLPMDWYRDMVIAGAKQNKLPSDYISFLETFAFKRDQKESRRNEKYQIIKGY